MTPMPPMRRNAIGALGVIGGWAGAGGEVTT